MTFVKRTWLYLIRKKGKTLILFLLLLIISTFVLSCVSILSGTKEAAANMRTEVGAALHIRSSANVYAQGNGETDAAPSAITEEVIQMIMKNDNLKYYNGRNAGYAKSLRFVQGAYHTDDSNMGRVSANNYSALHSYFKDNVLELIEGRHIIPGDAHVVLISETLAALNGLSVGDSITLFPALLAQENGIFVDALKDKTTTAKAEVIGIFREIEPQGNSDSQPTAGLRANLLFSDHELLAALHQKMEGEYTEGVSFYIRDPLYLNEIVKEIEQMDFIDWDSYFIRKDDFNYEKISAGLQTIQNLIRILLAGVGVVSIAVLMLILIMRMRGRIHETGILMSVGIPKKEILVQFLSEVIIVAFIAFLCSYFAAGFISNRIENGILEDLQVVQIEEQVLQTGIPSSSVPVRLLMPLTTSLTIYVCLLIVIVASVCLSSLAIMKLKPREILSKMS